MPYIASSLLPCICLWYRSRDGVRSAWWGYILLIRISMIVGVIALLDSLWPVRHGNNLFSVLFSLPVIFLAFVIISTLIEGFFKEQEFLINLTERWPVFGHSSQLLIVILPTLNIGMVSSIFKSWFKPMLSHRKACTQVVVAYQYLSRANERWDYSSNLLDLRNGAAVGLLARSCVTL